MEKPNNIHHLAQKWLDGTITPEEKAVFDRWYNDHDFSELKIDSPEGFDENILQEKLRSDIKHQIPQFAPGKLVRMWPRLAVAASVAIILAVGSLFYFNQHNKHTQEIAQIYDVVPGKQGATLTLANGKRIRLTDAMNGQLASEAGVIINKAKNGQLIYDVIDNSEEHNATNMLSTANGETYQVKLPDGSLVWLNAASSLTYPANFKGQRERRVKLEGEGYFEIAKDKVHPFIVESRGQEVEVLGTHFNVNAYADEPGIATTLLEGSVKVSSGDESQNIVPGQQALNSGGRLKVAKANIENITDWKDGEFNLDNLDFRTAMRKIARWYNVEVIYDKSVPEDIEIGGWIPRDSKLSSIVKLIENSGIVKCRIEGRKVYVSK